MNDHSPTTGNGALNIAAALIAKEDEHFVSLHELLTVSCSILNCSYQEAARVLLRIFKNTDSDDRPAWFELDSTHGMKLLTDRWGRHVDAMDCLEQAAQSGVPENEPPRQKDDFDDDIPF